MTNDDISEIQNALADLNKLIGGDFARAGVMIHTDDVSANAYFAKLRYTGDDFHSKRGDTPLEAIAAVRAEFIKQKADRERETIKLAALAIIEITYAQGECTDAALRGSMDRSITDEIIASAVEMANEMAEGGPFSVVEVRGANAA